MILGALLWIWTLLSFNLQAQNQCSYFALLACVSFMAYHLKKNRITIDPAKQILSVQPCWCFFFAEEEMVYGFNFLQQKVIETDSGRILTLFCPDRNRVAIYHDLEIDLLTQNISAR